MPMRSSNRIPRYRLHRPSVQGVVTLNGRDFYLGRYGTAASRARYDQLIAEWTAGGRRLSANDAGRVELTVNELILAYWTFAASYYRKAGKPTDEQHSLRAAFRPLRDLYGRCPSREFGPLALKTVRQALIDAGLSRKYINDSINRIRRMFRWGASEELLSPVVLLALQTVPGLTKRRGKARQGSLMNISGGAWLGKAGLGLARQGKEI